jgi:hypothetical protein
MVGSPHPKTLNEPAQTVVQHDYVPNRLMVFTIQSALSSISRAGSEAWCNSNCVTSCDKAMHIVSRLKKNQTARIHVRPRNQNP